MVPETQNYTGVESLQAISASLHELCQPLTVLLYALECGGSRESVVEMKEMFVLSQESCERLRKTVVEMQQQVRGAMKEVAGTAAGR